MCVLQETERFALGISQAISKIISADNPKHSPNHMFFEEYLNLELHAESWISFKLVKFIGRMIDYGEEHYRISYTQNHYTTEEDYIFYAEVLKELSMTEGATFSIEQDQKGKYESYVKCVLNNENNAEDPSLQVTKAFLISNQTGPEIIAILSGSIAPALISGFVSALVTAFVGGPVAITVSLTYAAIVALTKKFFGRIMSRRRRREDYFVELSVTYIDNSTCKREYVFLPLTCVVYEEHESYRMLQVTRQ